MQPLDAFTPWGTNSVTMSSDLTFITNEPGNALRERFGVLLRDGTRYFDCLVGYFFISGFYRLYPSLENVEKVRILVGLQTDRTAYELIQKARLQGEMNPAIPCPGAGTGVQRCVGRTGKVAGQRRARDWRS